MAPIERFDLDVSKLGTVINDLSTRILSSKIFHLIFYQLYLDLPKVLAYSCSLPSFHEKVTINVVQSYVQSRREQVCFNQLLGFDLHSVYEHFSMLEDWNLDGEEFNC